MRGREEKGAGERKPFLICTNYSSKSMTLNVERTIDQLANRILHNSCAGAGGGNVVVATLDITSVTPTTTTSGKHKTMMAERHRRRGEGKREGERKKEREREPILINHQIRPPRLGCKMACNVEITKTNTFAKL